MANDSHVVFQMVEKETMVNGVECCGTTYSVNCLHDIVIHLDKSSFRRMVTLFYAYCQLLVAIRHVGGSTLIFSFIILKFQEIPPKIKSTNVVWHQESLST